MISILRLLLGPPLANREQQDRKIGAFEGVPAMGLDGLGSASYGPEAALSVLIPAGAAGLAALGWVMAPILFLLSVLFVSYRQTIRAYPSNGGAYTVAKENLGANISLLAASALMIDYVLNVAVGISAGIGALTSAVSALHPYTLPLCLAILAVLTIANLRGTIDAGRLFAAPTYIFVASFVSIVAIGVFHVIASNGHPKAVVAPPPLTSSIEAVTAWLLIRSFAAGCTAMTGIEAVSNGIDAFREPAVKHGHRTLGAICLILGALLAGIAYLAHTYGIGAMDQTRAGYQSVLSQLSGAVVGRGAFYYVAIGSLLCVLAFSANTSFTGFPRLCRLIAQDEYLPRPFAIVGRRLVFSVGITYLAVTAGFLLFVFGGITDKLIPLFAIGAFLTFTVSQAGMVVHWRRTVRSSRGRLERHKTRVSMAINSLGAATTGIAFAVIVVAKFTEGAWITILVIPCVILLLKMIRSYYGELDARLRESGPLHLRRVDPPIVIVATQEWNKLTDKALAFALTISPDVLAVHLTHLEGPDAEEKGRDLRNQWSKDVERPARAARLRPPRLVLLQAPYRRIHVPLLKFVKELRESHPGRDIAVLIPEVVICHWWEYLLHTQRARRLRNALLRYGGSGLTVINTPWYLREPRIEQAFAAEEKAAGNHTDSVDRKLDAVS
jgi:amino acid transporter